MKARLIEKLREKKARIAIVGLGRVGLPTAAVFADAGYEVVGVDIKRDVVQAISAGRIRTKEPGLEELVRKGFNSGRLRASTETAKTVEECDVVIVCVQTPLDDQKKPALAHLVGACKEIAQGLSKGKLVIIESTVPPGTMKKVVTKILEEESALKCDADFWLTYCPERVTSGKILQELTAGDRIIGSFDEESADVATELLKNATSGKLSTTECGSAEVAKLAENTFRDVNIAFANELALICERVGVDVNEVIRLANTHPRVNIHSPGCGVGGPCLTKDSYLLLSSKSNADAGLGIIDASRKMNDYMPSHTVALVVRALEEVSKNLGKSRVAVLGVAYKRETGDATNSPAEQIIKGLMKGGAEVLVYDPFCEESFGAKRAQNVWEAIGGADCLVAVTAHRSFHTLSLRKIKALMSQRPVIVDGRRIFDPSKAKKRGFTYYGIGHLTQPSA